MPSPLPASGSGGYDVLAHGIGGAKDLPIPTELTIAGAVAALTISFTVLVVAWREPRYDGATSGRPAPAWLADPRRLAGLHRRCPRPRDGAVPLHRLGGGLRRGPADQPVLRHVLRAPVGRDRAGVAAARAVLEGDQPGAHHQRAVRPAHRRRPRARAVPLPTVAGLLAGRPGPVRLRLAGAGLPRARPSSARCGSGVALYVAAMLVGGAMWGTGFYERADPFEVYSTLVGKLSVWGRRDGSSGGAQPAGQPRHRRGPARPGRRGVRAVRQHRLRLVQGLRRVAAVHQPAPRVGVPPGQPGPARLLRRGRA